MPSVTEELLGKSNSSPKPLAEKPQQSDHPITDDLIGKPESKKAADLPLGSVVLKAKQPDKTAPFKAHLEAAIVDDPQTKLKLYAQNRFPKDPNATDRYGYHKGNVVFVGDDGEIYLEAGRGFLSDFKKGSAELAARYPSIVLGVAGSALGPGTSALGAMLGEGIRKAIGRGYGEPQTATSNVKSMATEGLYDVGGYATGTGAGRLIDYGLARRGGQLARTAGRTGRKAIDPRKIKEVEQLGKRFGIDLYPPHTTESRELIDRFNLLGDLPRTQDKIQAARRILMEQTDDAVYRFLDEIAPPSTTPMSAGRGAVDAAQESLKRAQQMKRTLTKPLYREAFKDNATVDVVPVLDYINEELKTAKGGIRSSLQKAKQLILKPDLPKKSTSPTLFDARGRKIPLGSETSYDTQLAGLHGAQMDLQRLIEGAHDSSIGRTTKRQYTIIRKKLLDQMDEASKKYQLARKAYASPLMSAEGEVYGSAVEDISRLEGEAVQRAAKRLLSSDLATPETVLRARTLIRRENPRAWDKVVRSYIQQQHENIKNNITDDVVNIGGKLFKQLFGNKRQRQILRSAMSPKQFNTWQDFLDVLRRTGHTFRRESATATRQEALQDMRKQAGSRIAAVGKTDVTAPFRGVSNWIDEALFGKYQDRLADALLSEKAAQQLKRLKQLNPRSEKFIKGFSTFMGQVVGNEFESRLDDEEIQIKETAPPVETVTQTTAETAGKIPQTTGITR